MAVQSTYREAEVPTGVVAKTPGSAPASSEITAAIDAIWREVLQRDKIEATDDFFDLGGTSLDLIHVFSKINAKFDLSLNGSILDDEVTLPGMAERVAAALNK
jgi:acyl carrier protein